MANFSPADTVETNAVYLRDIHSTISFSSKSDALFAAFVSRYPNLQWYIIDDLLAIFHDVSFLANEVTFKCAEDIADKIAKERRSLASARENRHYQPSMNSKAANGLPRVLVEVIAEQVCSERSPFVDVNGRPRLFFKLNPHDVSPDVTLRTMSLVHPSWTGIAQRCLRRRIAVWKRPELERLFRSPQLGPWVQELTYGDIQKDSHTLQSHPSEVERMLCGIIQRCPNLKRLHIDVHQLPFDAANTTSRYRIFQLLGHLHSLEGLWLRQSVSSRDKNLLYYPQKVVDFWDLYTTISRLQELKTISLSNLGFFVSEDPNVVSAHSTVIPNASLQSISIIDNAVKRPAEVSFFSRLIQPRNTFRLSCLDIDFPFLESLLPGKEGIMASITNLQVRLINQDLEELSSALEHCRSLYSLSLHMVELSFPNAMYPILPATVSNLSIYFDFLQDAEESFAVEPSFLLPMLKRSPHLKEITIYVTASALAMRYNEFYGCPYLKTGWDLSEPLPFHNIQLYCAISNMGFKLILAENPLPFLDHTYDSRHFLVDPSRPELFVSRWGDDDEDDEDEDGVDEDSDEEGEGSVD